MEKNKKTTTSNKSNSLRSSPIKTKENASIGFSSILPCCHLPKRGVSFSFIKDNCKTIADVIKLSKKVLE